jgi:methanogenic corrinoid protein MtbC1
MWELAMQRERRDGTAAAPPSSTADEWSNGEAAITWTPSEVLSGASKQRLARLARAIETDVIPRLVQAHRPAAANLSRSAAPMTTAEIETFVVAVLQESDDSVSCCLAQHRARGVTVESIYLDLLAPTARRLGEMWEEDTCDFSTVTVALGRMQCLLRDLSPAFGTEVEHPPQGRRAMFVQPRDEQHSFGLSMVAEFFRRDGWDVVGGIGGAVADPAASVHNEWIDILGFSVGSDGRLAWLRNSIAAARAASLNPGMRILVGGPLFTARSELAEECGADGTARTAKDAPMVAERLLRRSVHRI